MRKIILIFVFYFSFLITHYSISQNGWYNTFFNNTRIFTKIIQRDSLNYFAFSVYSKYYYKSNDAGNTWSSIKEYSLDSILNVYDGLFVNSVTGWIVGNNAKNYRGKILKTTNGGNNWFEQNTGENNSYSEHMCICFLNNNTGWVGSGVGSDGKLYKTTNGGNNWTVQIFSNSWRIEAVKFFDINNGWIMCTNKFLARTTDGGITWIQKTINNVQPANDIFYRKLIPISNNEAWALIVRNAGLIYSHLYRTTNGGDNWDLSYSYTDSLSTNANSMQNVCFQNFSTGFGIGGYNFYIKTSNSGNNWNRINTYSDLGFNANLFTMLFSGNTEIFGAGGGSGNYILKSINSGLNWTIKSLNRDYNFSQITFADNNKGFVITDTGRIYRTTNSGNNWDLNFNNNNYWFRKISFANTSTGCIIGSPHSYDYYARVLRTSNGGNNWTEIYSSSYLKAFTIQFIDQQNGFIGCDSNRLLITSNAGLNWNLTQLSHSFPFDIEDINFLNYSTGWLSGYYVHYYMPNSSYYRNIMWKTTNAGNNWSIIYDSVGYLRNKSVQFLNENTGIKALNYPSGYYKTTNGGANWFEFSLPNSITADGSFKFINPNTGWISSRPSFYYRNIIKTINGGSNWIVQLIDSTGGEFNSIYAFDNNNAWICGDNNSIYKTTDGGGNVGIILINNNIPDKFSLSQNYPNPFNPSTIIRFQIKDSKLVTLKVYDILGKEVTALVNEKLKPGKYEIQFPKNQYTNNQLPSGVYFYSLFADGKLIDTKKMLLIK